MGATRRDAAAIGEVVRKACEALDHADLEGLLLPALRELVDAEHVLLFRTGAGGEVVIEARADAERAAGEPTGRSRPDPAPRPEDAPHTLVAVLAPEPVAAPRLGARRSAGSSSAHQLEGRDATGGPFGAWPSPLPEHRPGATGLLLTRPQSAVGFGDEEQAILEALSPILRSTVDRVRRLHEILTEREAVEEALTRSPGDTVLIADAMGRLVWAAPGIAEALGTRAHRGTLPARLATAVRDLVNPSRSDAAPAVPALDLGDGRVTASLYLIRTRRGPFVGVTVGGGSPADRPSTVEGVLVLALRHGLTDAETRVLSGIACGLPNREIAQKLFVSVETVKTHVSRILGKLEVSSRTQAALLVARSTSA